MGREGNMSKVRSFILAALVMVAANSAYACNENCRAIFTDPLTRETTEGIDEACVMRREACHECAREKVERTGATLECVNCVIDTNQANPTDLGKLSRCIPLCGNADKAREVYFSEGCL
jgi:hypothetical protein